jgi:hypothetical protein
MEGRRLEGHVTDPGTTRMETTSRKMGGGASSEGVNGPEGDCIALECNEWLKCSVPSGHFCNHFLYIETFSVGRGGGGGRGSGERRRNRVAQGLRLAPVFDIYMS